VIPPEVTTRISIEAGATQGWHRYIGLQGEAIGIDHFGASAPMKVLLKEFGFTPENILDKIKALLVKKKG
jgi:transketolase